MIWLMTIGVFWYAWGVYTLSYNPDQFPDPNYALKVWYKRASRTAFLGALILTTVLFFRGKIPSWWAVPVVFVGCCILAAMVQMGLAGLLILGRSVKAVLRIRLGLRSRVPFLAPFVWGYYITEEEKLRARTESRAQKPVRESTPQKSVDNELGGDNRSLVIRGDGEQ
jgi:hypothetical protein